MQNIAITNDKFLDGSLNIQQPEKGYRAGIDAVLLAAAGAKCQKAQNIAELGCGVGVAILSLLCFNENKTILATGIEKDDNSAKLFRENLKNNGFDQRVSLANIDGLIPNSPFENKFDLIISNPPFFDDLSTIRAPHDTREHAYIIGQPLEKWIVAMLRLCHAKGEILIIHRADRMFDILKALEGRAGDIRILPIHPKTTQNANRILVRAKKSSKAMTQILPSLYLRDIEKPDVYLPQVNAMCNGVNLEQFMGLFQ